MTQEPTFKNYKEKQNYYKEKYKNRGAVVWISKVVGRDGKILQPGRTYSTELFKQNGKK